MSDYPDHYRAMYVTPNGKHHLIRMEQGPHTKFDRRSLCGTLQAIPIDDVWRQAREAIPAFARCWSCWRIDQ